MIRKRWTQYWDYIIELPSYIGISLAILIFLGPILAGSLGLIAVMDSHFKTTCLNSQMMRRWSPTDRICQEYHDGEWIEIDLAGDNIYHYNNEASQSVTCH